MAIAIPLDPRVSLCRALSKLGVLSRTQAERAVVAGRVAVDGRIVRDPMARIDPDRVDLALDGQPVRRVPRRTVAMHKPVGVLTTRADERGRPTVQELLPADLPHLGPVGRLDQDSSGLLLFTNDTQLGNAITGPGSHLAKVYEVDLDGPLCARDEQRMAEGMLLDGEALLPIGLRFVDPADRCRAVFTLREGKNRQIRRMAAACGRTVLRLHRIAIGPLLLGDQPVASVRELTAAELRALRQAAGLAP